MPPARIPRLSLPAWVSFPGTHKVPIRQWILKQIRVVRDPPRRWRAELNAKRVMSEFCRADFEDWSVQQFEELLKLQSLHAIRAPLRLPQFPTGKTSQKQLSRAWAVWANLTRIPPRAFQHGSKTIGALRNLSETPYLQPPQWQRMERPMYEALESGMVLVGDDRDACKVWCVDGREMFAYMVKECQLDLAWSMRRDLTPSDVCQFSVARAMLGLPAWLRRGEPGPVRSPSIFPLIKSKCFADDGTKTCVKPGHSCWRRVVDCSQVAWPRAWKAVARGTRGLLRTLNLSHEVFDLSKARHHIDEMVSSIQAHSDMCWKCGTPLHQMSVVVADIDQAFEACESSAVMPAFEFFRVKFLSRHGQWIWVRKTKKEATTTQLRTGQKGWWKFDMQSLSQALFAFCWMTLVCTGDVVWQMKGLAIGGIVSSVAVSLVLGFQEAVWDEDPGLRANHGFDFGSRHVRECVGFKRYVDDVLSCSCVLCGSCLFQFLTAVYSQQKLSPCSGVDMIPDEIHTWADVDMKVVSGSSLLVMPKSANKKWLSPGMWTETCNTRTRASFIPWPGTLPMPFSQFRGIVVGRLYRAQALKCGPVLASIRVLEDVQELFLLGYPASLRRALVHSLPDCAEKRAICAVIRQWQKKMGGHAKSGKGKQYDDKRDRQSSGGARPSYSGDNWKNRSHGHHMRRNSTPSARDRGRSSRGRSRSRSWSSSQSSSSSSSSPCPAKQRSITDRRNQSVKSKE